MNPETALHPWRRAGGADRSRRRLGDGQNGWPRRAPTIDLRVDYHTAAMPGDLTVRGKVVRMGSQFSTAEARVLDAEGKLLASGRGTYFTAPPKDGRASETHRTQSRWASATSAT